MINVALKDGSKFALDSFSVVDEARLGKLDDREAVNLLRRGYLAWIYRRGHRTPFIQERFPERYALKEQDGILNPDAIAENYWQLHRQHRSAWTHELDLRPWMEKW